MPKGGRRRRRGRRPRSIPGSPVREAAEARAAPSAQAPGGRRRRRRRSGGATGASAIARMAGPRPRQLQTLPDDGIVLEELIATLRDEYGTPTTPQEYRLLIKVPSDEGKPLPREPEEPESAPQELPAQMAPSPRPRRRRRRRGRRPESDSPDAPAPTDPRNESPSSDA